MIYINDALEPWITSGLFVLMVYIIFVVYNKLSGDNKPRYAEDENEERGSILGTAFPREEKEELTKFMGLCPYCNMRLKEDEILIASSGGGFMNTYRCGHCTKILSVTCEG